MIRELKESDLEEKFSRASGPGGQNVNKVATKVTLIHRPTGTQVIVQEGRSQPENRRLARERLLETLQEEERRLEETRRQAAAKKRRQRAKRPKAVKERILDNKKRRSEIKEQRRWKPGGG